ncbi:FkbM family methyltransferase [Brevundimonas sp. TWP2-3-2]|uniref:FkbM family methyltransferase n=1 Tax=unclassified Brevundimonas TaxID=2622653 RepID=UPI003CE7C487
MRLLKDLRLQKPQPAELNLIGLNELLRMDRWVLERRSRALVQTAFLGNQLTLCRVLGRYKLYVPTTDVGFGAHVMMDGLWESWLTVFMASRIKPGMRVVDAGANHGYYTVFFADLVGPEGRVAAVEPSPRTASLLRQTVIVNGFDSRVSVFENALVATDGETLVFHTPSSEPKNARVVTSDHAGHLDMVEVTGARLDTLIADWPRVDFIKVDVEGAEEAALSGAWGVIERDRPELLLEFNGLRCQDPAGLLDRLEALYGPARTVGFDSALHAVSREALLSPDDEEDQILYFTPR